MDNEGFIDRISEFSIVEMNGEPSSNSGLLLYKGGTVCDDDFDRIAANALCSYQGYASSGSTWTSGNKWSIQSNYKMTLDEVNCRTRAWSSCTYSESPKKLYEHSEKDVFLNCTDTGSGEEFICRES